MTDAFERRRFRPASSCFHGRVATSPDFDEAGFRNLTDLLIGGFVDVTVWLNGKLMVDIVSADSNEGWVTTIRFRPPGAIRLIFDAHRGNVEIRISRKA